MNKANSRTWIGMVLIILGGLLVFDNLNIISFDLFSWPVILIAIGAIMIANSENSSPGFILVVLGGLFLSTRIFDVSFGDLITDFWPLIFIIAGLMLLVKKHDGSYTAPFSNSNRKGFSTASEDIIDVTSVFSDKKIDVTSQNFRGGKATALFGAAEIDLYNAKMADGVCEIDIAAVFGGVAFFIPVDWNVQLKVTSIFGGFEDKRRKSPVANLEEGNVLIITGTVLFGGGEVKS